MAARDRFEDPLECKGCGKEGSVTLSQLDGYSFMNEGAAHKTDVEL